MLRLAIWQQNTHIFDLSNHEPSISFIGEGGWPRVTKCGGKIQIQTIQTWRLRQVTRQV